MIHDSFHDAVRFLPRATTVGMVVVVALQFAGRLSPPVGLFDVITLAVVGAAARVFLRSRTSGAPRR